MNNLPVEQQSCVVVRGGIEFWVPKERAEGLKKVLQQANTPRFIEINSQFVNTYEVIGVFTPDAVEEKRRRANGEWTCKWGRWHSRGSVCEHTGPKKQPVVELDETTGKAVVVGYKETL